MRLMREVFALALIAPAVLAQSPIVPAWPVASGIRVSVSSPILGDNKQVGVVVPATRDALSFRSGTKPAYTSIGTSDIRQIEISEGTHSRRLNKVLIGFLVGAAGGAVIGAAVHRDRSPCLDALCVTSHSRSEDALIGATAGGVLGAIVGAIVGGRSADTRVPIAVPVN
jgi:hypothetical protein